MKLPDINPLYVKYHLATYAGYITIEIKFIERALLR